MAANIPRAQAPAATNAGTAPELDPYAQRVIELTFQLGGSSVFTGGGDTLTVSGLRVETTISRVSTPSAANAVVRVYGLSLDHINTLTKAGTSYYASPNTLQIKAGDKGGATTVVFTGIIYEAYPDFDGQPEVAFTLIAGASTGLQLKPVKPISFPSSVSAEQALTQVFQPAGIKISNLGVNVQIAAPYLWGTVWQQALQVVQAAQCAAYYDSDKKEFVIMSKLGNGVSSPGQPILLAPETGMIGYPRFEQNKIVVSSLFRGSVLTRPTDVVRVKSQLTSANGLWTAFNVDLVLASESPNGDWKMVVGCAPNAKK